MGAEREQWCPLPSPPDFSLSLRYPQSNWAPLVLVPEWVGLRTLQAPVGLSNDLSCESLLLLPQPPRAFSIRGLRRYFPALEPWVAWSASLPAVCPGLSMHECGVARCYPLLCLPRSPPL